MSANELAGVVLAVSLGVAALVPLVVRLARDPRSAVMWSCLGSFVLLLVLFLVLGAAAWGGSNASLQKGAVHCSRGDLRYEASDWDRRPPDRLCPAGFTAHFEYCETFAPGSVKQPVNTWSGLAFATAAFWGLFFVRRRAPSSDNDVMRTYTVFSVGMAMTFVFVWWGTMALHASWRSWGGYLDAFSILVWLLFTIAYSLGRRAGLLPNASRPRALGFLLVFLVLAAAVGLVVQLAPDARLVLLIVFGASALAVEFAVLIHQGRVAGRRPLTVVRSWRWYLALAGAFAAAFVCKLLADFLPLGSRWCSPDSPLQGHALWHVFAALTAFFAFMYYRAEIYTPGLTRFDRVRPGSAGGDPGA